MLSLFLELDFGAFDRETVEEETFLLFPRIHARSFPFHEFSEK